MKKLVSPAALITYAAVIITFIIIKAKRSKEKYA